MLTRKRISSRLWPWGEWTGQCRSTKRPRDAGQIVRVDTDLSISGKEDRSYDRISSLVHIRARELSTKPYTSASPPVLQTQRSLAGNNPLGIFLKPSELGLA